MSENMETLPPDGAVIFGKVPAKLIHLCVALGNSGR